MIIFFLNLFYSRALLKTHSENLKGSFFSEGPIRRSPFPKGCLAVWAFGKESLGPLGVVYYYFRKWQRNGVLRNLTWKLNTLFRQQKSKESTPSVLSIDSQSVKKAPFVLQRSPSDKSRRELTEIRR